MRLTPTPSDDELLALSATQPDAFGEFYRRHAEAVLGYLRYRTGDIEVAADLTADVFAAAFVARRRYRPRREPARAWLFGIANNLVLAEYRSRRRAAAARARLAMTRIEFDDEDLIAADRALEAPLRERLEEALLNGLPDAQRDAVIARVVHERDYAGIARQQACSEDTVRQRVSRGLARLALALREGHQ